MALPIAPLGFMPNINLPNYVPNTVVPDRNPWNQALAAFLAGAAGSAGGRLADNTFSRDYADQVGQKPAGFLDKMVSGPTVSKDLYAQQAGNKAISDRLDKEIAAVDARLTKQMGQQASEFNVTSGQANRRLDLQAEEQKALREQFKTTSAQNDRRLSQTDTQIADAKNEFTQKLDLSKQENALREKEVNARLEQLVNEGRLSSARADAIAVEMGKTKEETRGLKRQNDYLDKRLNGGKDVKNPLEGAVMPDSSKLPPTPPVSYFNDPRSRAMADMGGTSTNSALPAPVPPQNLPPPTIMVDPNAVAPQQPTVPFSVIPTSVPPQYQMDPTLQLILQRLGQSGIN